MTTETQAPVGATVRRIEELDETARRHKRAADRQRRLARRYAREADALRAALALRGIKMEVRRGE